MTGREKIDRITASIESKVKKVKSASEIAEEVARESGINERDLSKMFTFMTDKTLIGYIKERKINAACEYLVENEGNNSKATKQYAISLSGLGDQSALIKKFRDIYSLTLQEICDKKDSSLLSKRMSSTDFFNTETQESTTKNTGTVITNETVFGLTRKKYEEVKKAFELQELYDFDELQSETAYYIYKTYDIPLKDAFRFVDEYEYHEDSEEIDEQGLNDFFGLSEDYQFAPEEEEIPHLSREEFYEEIVKKYADNPEIRYAYFDVGIASISAIYNLIDKLHALGDNDITELEPELIIMCAYNDFDARFCKKAVAYYLNNKTEEYGDDAFDEYVGYLLDGQYIEVAFENIWNTEGWDDYETDCLYLSMEELNRELIEDDPNDPFEKWAAEETDYSDKYR